ncbi:MAG: FixH family protein [Salibacteraceae bacterium]
MKNKLILCVVGVALLSFIGPGCKNEIPEPPNIKEMITSDFVFITSTQVAEHTLSLYADEQLKVGYNQLYMIMEDQDEKLITDFEINSIRPMMDMGNMEHSTPIEPVSKDSYRAQVGIVFIMPSTAGDWRIDLGLSVGNQNYEETLTFDVEASDPTRLLSFVDSISSISYFIALVEPRLPEVGENDFILGIYQRESMMSFPQADDLSVEIEPWMPSMSHGSTNNVNPTQKEDGLYHGVVNYSMAGDWEVRLVILNNSGDTLAQDLSFEFLL